MSLSRRTMLAGAAAIAPTLCYAADKLLTAAPRSVISDPPRDFGPNAAPAFNPDPDIIRVDPAFGGLLIGTVVLAQNLIDSPAGRALQALHGSETAASVAGIDVGRRKIGVFVLSATVSAMLGSLSAHYSGYINPGIAGFMQSVELVIIVVLGGMASIYGSIFGAVVMGLLPQILAGYEGWDSVLFGVILVVTMIFLPRGVVPSLAARLRSVRFAGKGGTTC